jgi:hypothetical protein
MDAKDRVEARRDAPPLRVFVSYTHDSEEHKKWVLALVAQLRNDGIDAIVDQMHLTLGAYSPEFMERAVRESSRVLVVCTEKYKQRFDSREGGAGYEGHIITGEIVNEVGKNKFIPLLRQGDWKTAIPTALSGVNRVDLRNEATTEYQKLIKNLYNVSAVTPITRALQKTQGVGHPALLSQTLQPLECVRIPGCEQQQRGCLSVRLSASLLPLFEGAFVGEQFAGKHAAGTVEARAYLFDHFWLDLGQRPRIDFIGPQRDFPGAMRLHGCYAAHQFVEQIPLVWHGHCLYLRVRDFFSASIAVFNVFLCSGVRSAASFLS